VLTRPVPSDFLLIKDRLSRPPLQNWAKSIRCRLEEELTRGGRDLLRVASLLNLAALVEVLRGDTPTARAICDAELVWLASLASQCSERGAISTLALQPWINIGRLCRIEGRMEEALHHFALVLRRAAPEPLALGPYCITNEDWEALLTSDTLENLWNVYVVDSLKTYFKFRQFDAALGFIARLRDARLYCWDNVLLEGEIISHAGLGDYEGAYSLAKSWGGQEILDTLVLMLYEASCLAAFNRYDQANFLTRDLISFVTLGGLDSFTAPITMRYLDSLGALLESLARQVDAARIYDRAYNVAIGVDDQPFQISFLRAKSRQLGHEQSPKLKETRAVLLGDCYYDEILRSEGLPGKRWNQTFGDLLASVSMATSGALVL
jgi:hypothetical protein